MTLTLTLCTLLHKDQTDSHAVYKDRHRHTHTALVRVLPSETPGYETFSIFYNITLLGKIVANRNDSHDEIRRRSNLGNI